MVASKRTDSPAFWRGVDDVLRERGIGTATPAPTPAPAPIPPVAIPTGREPRPLPPVRLAREKALAASQPVQPPGLTVNTLEEARRNRAAGIQAQTRRTHDEAAMSSRLGEATGGNPVQIQQGSPYEIRQQIRAELARVYPETPVASLNDDQLLALASLASQQGWQFRQPPANQPQAAESKPSESGAQPSKPEPPQVPQADELKFLEENLAQEESTPEIDYLSTLAATGGTLSDGTPVTPELVQEAARIQALPDDSPEKQEIRTAQDQQEQAALETRLNHNLQQIAILRAKGEKDPDWLQFEGAYQIQQLHDENAAIGQALNNPGDLTGWRKAVNIVATAIGSVGMSVIDEPRQAVVTWAGENAYDVASGKDPRHQLIDWSPWGDFLNPSGFNEWYENPKNAPFIRDAYENGFTGKSGEHFTGGRAVWELYAELEMPTWYERGATDLLYDPLNIPMALSVAGKGAEVLGGLAARSLPEAIGRPAETALTTTGRVLGAPQRVLDVTTDLVPNTALGLAGGLVPSDTRIGGKVRGLFAPAPETQLEHGVADAEQAITEVQKASAQQPISIAPEALPPDSGPNLSGPSAGAVPIAETLTIEVAKPSSKTVKEIRQTVGLPKDMGWIVEGAGKDYADQMLLALRQNPERAVSVGSIWKQLAAEHQAMNAGSARLVDADHLFSHVDLAISMRKMWRDEFPELAFPAYVAREKPQGVKALVQQMVFGSPEESRAAFKAFAEGTTPQQGRSDADRSVWKYTSGQRIPYGQIRNRAMATRIEWESLVATNQGLPSVRQVSHDLAPLASAPNGQNPALMSPHVSPNGAEQLELVSPEEVPLNSPEGAALPNLAGESPEPIPPAVEWSTRFPRSATKRDQLVETGRLSPEQADQFYQTNVAPGRSTDQEVREQLHAWDQLANQPANGNLGMFAGAALESPEFGRANQVITELQHERRGLVELRTRLLSLTGDATAQPGAQLSDAERAMVTEVEQEISGIEDKLNGKVRDWFTPAAQSTPPEGTPLFDLPSDKAVGIMPDSIAQARRSAKQANTAAIEARIAGQQALTGMPLVLSDRTQGVLDRVFTQGDLAGVTWRARLEDLMGRPLEDASFEEIADAMVRLRHDLQLEYGLKESGRWGRQLDAANRAFSAFTLMPFWSLPRQIVGNTILGNTVQQGLAGHFRAILAGLDPRNLKEFLTLARKGEVPMDSPAYRLLDELGRGPHPLEFRGYATAAVGGGKRNAATKLAQGARPGLLTGIKSAKDPVADAVNRLTGVRFGREVVNAFEWSFRVGAGSEHVRNYMGKNFGSFVDEAIETGRRLAPEIPEIDLRIALEGPGWRTNPQEMADRLVKLGSSYGMTDQAAKGFGVRVSRDFANQITKAEDVALSKVHKSLFSFETKNIDVYLRRMMPFHMYLTRAYPFYAEQMIRHPGFAAAWFRSHEGLDRYAEENGWPASMKGFVQIMSGPLGLALFAKPLIAAGLMDMFVDVNGGYEPQHLSAIGKALGDAQQFGFSFLPWWSALLNISGYMGDSSIGLDPTGTFSARKLFGSVAQSLAAHGVFGDDWERYLGKPYEQRLADLREHLSGILPGSSQIESTDVAAAGAQVIRNLMLTAALEDHGLTQTQFDALALQPEGSPERDTYDEILEQVVAQWDQQDGEYFDLALESYSDFDAIQGNIARATITGPKTMRSMDQIDRSNTAYRDEGDTPPEGFSWWPQQDPYVGGIISSNEAQFLKEWEQQYGEPYKPGDLERLEAAQQTSADVSRLTPDAAPIVIADRERDTIGDPSDRDLLDMWTEIAYGDMQPGINDNKTYQIGGRIYWYWQIANASQEDRFALADQFVADRDPDGSVQKLRDDRKIFDSTHPEYGLYQQWAKEARKSWEQYGANAPRMYRAQVSKDNPNAARWFNEQTRRIREKLGPGATVREINRELDKLTFSMDAYMAIKGIQREIGDPKVLDHTADPRTGATDSGSTGGSGGATSQQDWPTRVRAAIEEAQTQSDEASRILSAAVGQPVDAAAPVPPEFADWRAGVLTSAGFTWGDDHWIYEDYVVWAQDQLRLGLVPTIDGFIQYTQEEQQKKDGTPPRPEDLLFPSAAD